MNSPLNITVSCFANAKSTTPKPVNLFTWLTSEKYKPQVEVIRQTEDKEARDKLKLRLPAITPSGQFTKRNQYGLVKHSGLLCIDIDHQDNKHIGNYSDLKQHLCNIQNFAFVGLSVSGNGFYCLMPISQPDKHELHFKAIQSDLERFGIVVDKSGSDVPRLRFYSFDNEAYFNHQAIIYTKVYQIPTPQPSTKQRNNTAQATEPLDIVVNMVRGSRDGEKHLVLYKAARLAGGYIAGNQIDETAAINALENAISNKSNVNSLEDAFKTIRDGIETGKNAPITKPQQEVEVLENVNNVNNVENVIVSNVQKPILPDNREFEQYLFSTKPLKKATGRLAELESIFVHDKSIYNRLDIIKLFDYCKREQPTPELLNELERLIVKSENLQQPKGKQEVLFHGQNKDNEFL